MKRFLPLFISLICILSLQLLIFTLKNLGWGITYNKSASIPQGFYLIIPQKKIQRNDIVAFLPPPAIIKFLDQHNWWPSNHVLLKYAMGLPDDFVCNRNQTIWINGKKIAPILSFYAPHKKLPQVKLCRKLRQNEYLLLSTKIERSFDGRYFGPVNKNRIIGGAKPLPFSQCK